MSFHRYKSVLDTLLPGWRRVDSDYPTFHTYQHDTQWWVVIELTGDNAGAVRVTRTDSAGRHIERVDPETAWMPTHSTDDIRRVLAASGAPDIAVPVEVAA